MACSIWEGESGCSEARKTVELGPESEARIYWGFSSAYNLLVEISDKPLWQQFLIIQWNLSPNPQPCCLPQFLRKCQIVNGEEERCLKSRSYKFLVTWLFQSWDQTHSFHLFIFLWSWMHNGKRTPPGLRSYSLLCIYPIKPKTIWRILLAWLCVYVYQEVVKCFEMLLSP